MSVELLTGRDHYDVLVDRALRDARISAWIATANVKDLHVQAPLGTRARARGRFVSILELFSSLSRRGVELRLLHGATPSRPFRAALARHDDLLGGGLPMRHCPRVHLKMIAVDGSLLYLGSANLTGAGLGAKADRRRNFEAGIVTDDDLLLDRMQRLFDEIWAGKQCGSCAVRKHCPSPLDTAAGTAAA